MEINEANRDTGMSRLKGVLLVKRMSGTEHMKRLWHSNVFLWGKHMVIMYKNTTRHISIYILNYNLYLTFSKVLSKIMERGSL